MAEFVRVAERGVADDEKIEALKRRLTASRRRTASLAQAVVDHDLAETGADEELAVAQGAARQMRNVRDIGLLTACTEEVEARALQLEDRVASLLAQRAGDTADEWHAHITSSDVIPCMRSTTTNQLSTGNAVTSSGLAERSSGSDVACSSSVGTDVEADLDQHGVDPDFIEIVAPELCGGLPFGRARRWGEIIALAEQLANRHRIHRQAWHEAGRLMGQRGAAAAVIATLRKYQNGDVDRPGADLRGMSERAAKGELHLGRTFHGLKDQQRAGAMKAMRDGDDPRSVGELARYAFNRQLVLSGRSSATRGEGGQPMMACDDDLPESTSLRVF